MTDRPSVLFACVHNAGKSQLAAGLMKDLVGDAVDVHSAGTVPSEAVNEQSAQSLAELGIDITAERPKRITEQLVRDVDVVVTLGLEARVDPVEGTRFQTWDTDEPSARGIEGMDRMRLVRDDIARRVEALATELGVAPRAERTRNGEPARWSQPPADDVQGAPSIYGVAVVDRRSRSLLHADGRAAR